MATIDYVGDSGPDGVVVGKTATTLLGFHGATPSDQRASLTVATAATIATIRSGVQEIIALLKEKGLMAT
jgi:hypothetical protein